MSTHCLQDILLVDHLVTWFSSHRAKSLADDYDEQIKSYFEELDRLRATLRDAACVDLSLEICNHALEWARRWDSSGETQLDLSEAWSKAFDTWFCLKGSKHMLWGSQAACFRLFCGPQYEAK